MSPPVGNYHSLKTQFVAEDCFQQVAVDMAGDAVYIAGIHHHGVRAGLYGCGKRGQKIFAQRGFGDQRGAAITARGGVAVADVMLQRRTDVNVGLEMSSPS